MKNKTLLAGLSVLAFLNLCGCKADKLVQPAAKNSPSSQVSSDPLINYLSALSKVSTSSISFDYLSNEYVIRNSVRISKSRLEASYKTANEYKLRSNIKFN
ncbi:MAG TPA: hypothetical protein VL490_09715 [Mucilaginibacter sp.]|jgi:hypothetical protein|nr:hypothetical protein [Mucilaginibacter sp.]